MSQTIPEILKSCEAAYAEKSADYERAKEAFNKAQFELLSASHAAFDAFKKWSNIKEQFLVELVNKRTTPDQSQQDTSQASNKTEAQ